MFRKKEYVILLVIAAVLITYLSLNKRDKTHYRLPEVAQLETDKITRIEIAGPGGKKALTRKEEGWYLEPEGYLVDGDKAADMLKVIGKLSITDLVSSSANFTRYELDEAQKISVSAWEGSTTVRTFDIGKAAPTFQHTYLRWGDDLNVYQARGHFRIKFDQSAEELRDKKVLVFKTDEIRTVRLSTEGEALELQKDAAAAPAESDSSDATSKPENQGKQEDLWRSDKDQAIDQNEVKGLLSDLSQLECTQFINDGKPDDMQNPTLQITLTGPEEYRLSLFAPLASDTAKIPASSSAKDTPFFLSEWNAKSITEAARKLMGLEEKAQDQASPKEAGPTAESGKTPES